MHSVLDGKNMEIEVKTDVLSLYLCGEANHGVWCHCVVVKHRNAGINSNTIANWQVSQLQERLVELLIQPFTVILTSL